MIIAVDAMGGDYAPKAVVEGAELASNQLGDKASIILIGDEEELSSLHARNTKLVVHHAPEAIGMHEHPAKAFKQKPNSSIGVGFQLLKKGHIQAFCSAGNTGAMMVGALFVLTPFEGVKRPPIAGFFPLRNGGRSLMLDIGANAECKPEVLNQFAELGSVYMQCTQNLSKPRVALLNMGEEEQKGTANLQATYQLLQNNPKIDFIGNLESRSIFEGEADVVVTEGFAGNVIFKMGEAFYEHAHKQGVNDPFINQMNYEVAGGSPIIGVRGNVIVGHGISSPQAIKNMILLAYQQSMAGLNEKLENYFIQKAS